MIPQKTRDGVYVTPEIAAQWLARSPSNRKITQAKVDAYAADMLAGRWRYNGDRIRVRPDGTLQDGHHRLTACVQSGEPIIVDVFVITADAEATVDKGKSRTTADTLTLSGKVAPSHSTTMAAALRMLTLHDNTTLNDWAKVSTNSKSSKFLTDQAIAEYYDQNSHEVLRAVEWAHEHVKLRNTLISKSQAVAFLVLASREFDWDSASEYLYSVLTGDGIEPGTTAEHIRDRLLSVKMRQSKMSTTDKLYSVCKGFRSIMSGRNIKHKYNATFRHNIDNFPRFEVKK